MCFLWLKNLIIFSLDSDWPPSSPPLIFLLLTVYPLEWLVSNHHQWIYLLHIDQICHVTYHKIYLCRLSLRFNLLKKKMLNLPPMCSIISRYVSHPIASRSWTLNQIFIILSTCWWSAWKYHVWIGVIISVTKTILYCYQFGCKYRWTDSHVYLFVYHTISHIWIIKCTEV